MAEWATAEQTEFTHLYDELKKRPNYDTYSKKANEQILSGEQLPYKEAKSRLLKIIEEQKMEQYQKEGIEHKAKSTSSSGLLNLTRAQSLAGLSLITLGLFAMSGIYIPPLS